MRTVKTKGGTGRRAGRTLHRLPKGRHCGASARAARKLLPKTADGEYLNKGGKDHDPHPLYVLIPNHRIRSVIQDVGGSSLFVERGERKLLMIPRQSAVLGPAPTQSRRGDGLMAGGGGGTAIGSRRAGPGAQLKARDYRSTASARRISLTSVAHTHTQWHL